MVPSFAGKPYLIECPLPKAWHHTAACDEHDSLAIKSKEVRCLMLLIIDPKFRRDLEFLGSDKLAQPVDERFREPVDKGRAKIFKEFEVCRNCFGIESSNKAHQEMIQFVWTGSSMSQTGNPQGGTQSQKD
ncbi:hypothetical protein L2E82_45381 [Cichorium intybus]|uniref:Uncharacterized protein n=1 Tax=Cichorium intybus TaxID=13427 RepID=A0ACB8ZU69_CICIN|nr:hypothetical protein L2E82_45381 [Cichorium intybus]